MSATILSGTHVTESQLETIKDKAKQWALLHGVQMRPPSQAASTSVSEYAPMTLFPSMVPMAIMQEAKALQPHFNRLMHKVAHDHQFLKEALQNVIKVDEFTRNLWDIYTAVRTEGFQQSTSLGLFRNDFMMDVKDSCCLIQGVPALVNLRQIEFNTISASFGGLASGMWQVHRYTMQLAKQTFTSKQIPENCPARGLARGMVEAWRLYGNESAVILCLAQACERNTMDQKWLEKFIVEETAGQAHMVYCTLSDACSRCQLTPDKRLLLDQQDVAVVYFRDGYTPDSYTSNKHWEARLRIERSRAIKCPSIHYQLAGCKKIQQELAAPGALEKFITDKEILAGVRNTFAGQYSLDEGPAGDEAIAMAMISPEKFVLKPQREGGGNNLYGKDIQEYLEKISDTAERNAYILMERIFPWPQKNYLLKTGEESHLRDVISELGIYGVYIGSSEEELMNEEVGHLLRTKSSTDNEGGVTAGFATIDTPFLFSSQGISCV